MAGMSRHACNMALLLLSCGLVHTPKSIRNERGVIVIRSCGSVVIYNFNDTGRNYSASLLPFQLLARNTHLSGA